MTETYQQAMRANWPRPTCVDCHAPTAYDREFKATGRCQACYRETELVIVKGHMIQEKEESCNPI